MSKILTKTVKKTTLLSVVLAVIMAVAVVIGVLCGVKGWGVFNKSALMKDSNALTVTVNYSVYQTRLDEVQDACDDVFSELNLKASYVMKGEMSGEENEVVYVFDKDVDLSEAKAALETKFEGMKANEWKDVLVFVTVASASETVISNLAEYYVLGGIFAAIALAALVFAYAAFRQGLAKGILTAVCAVVSVAVTAALMIITRIPVSASVMYVLAASALVATLTTTFFFNKIRENEKKGECASAEELVETSLATKEIGLFFVLAGVALVLMGAVATNGVRWFAIQSLVALVVASFVGLLFAPALYLPVKEAADKKPVKDAYVGAKKTSTKVKKTVEKVAPVAETPVEVAPVEEIPTEEVVEETPVEEVPAEEVVEETPAEEITAEEPAEETNAEENPAE
ncbi:MAG: hypothetical protein IKZ28_01655 [Clostridia bacterium]|nr:hypothetical protein [Clostridia bacterium]